ncbi:MAG: endonuclease/exonuclease/phosphatase family protein [Planctomycetia bacterium]|nr:endonuclease/exonuclease/phosphatase family protein [Planctomycetia bacterium]
MKPRTVKQTAHESSAATGLILIQIDGLSIARLRRATTMGAMPFLKRLLDRNEYQLRTMYSGLPSTTPAVQGELFYAVQQAVPAFGYVPRGAAEPVWMNDSEQAERVEATLCSQQDGILQGGSAHSNIFSGGAAEPRFCAATMGGGTKDKSARSGPSVLRAMLQTQSLLRAAGETAVELGVAVYDFAQGVLQGHLVRPEMRIIPSRVAVGVLLRDAITSAACYDAERGLPVIQLNYLGYDEKAHCRGPGSRFAFRALRGIDRSIQRIWKAAARSDARKYQLWVYSDHGQEEVEPYEPKYGRTLQEAVEAIWNVAPQGGKRHAASATRARAGWLGGRWSKYAGGSPEKAATDGERPEVSAIAIGPLGYIYTRDPLSTDQRLEFARRLVAEANVPVVVAAMSEQATRALTPQGEFQLPADAAQVLGAEHPFLQTAAEDLCKLCRHPDAGELLICGWRPHETPLTFVQEVGAHGGPGANECSAFVLAPQDADIDWDDATLFRPTDLRTAIGRTRDQASVPAAATARSAQRTSAKSLRVMTYNVHSCRGADGQLSPERIAQVIEASGADVAALQELDVRRRSSAHVDQAQRIAELLGWQAYFHPARKWSDEEYGDAILSRFPIRLEYAAALPGAEWEDRQEPRGAIWVELDVDGVAVQIVNTHLGLTRRERTLQIQTLLGADWLGNERCREPLIFCGDLNALPRSTVYRSLSGSLQDVQRARNGRRFATFPSRLPLLSLDHIFTRGLEVLSVESPRNRLARRASDHLPLLAELRF